MQPALQEEIDTLRSRYRSDRDPAGLVFASLADAYRRAGELDEAWSLLEEGLEEHPDFATGHLVAARVLRDRGASEDADWRYDRVLDLDPENTAALREKAALAQDEGRIEQALSLCQRLALLEPTDADLRARIRTLKESHFRAAEVEATREEVAWYEGLPIPEGPVREASGQTSEEAFDDESGGAVEEEAPPGIAEEEETVEEEGGEREGPEVFTRTMADLYARQGHVERALRIYGHLLDREPENESLLQRIRELEGSDQEPSPEGPTIASYFNSLLAWESRS